MKRFIFSCLAAIAILISACCKDQPKDPNDMNVPGLPPATQSGANTLGFLLNGVPWTPEGPNNLSIDFDPGFNNGIFNIAATRTILNVDNSGFALSAGDSVNFISAPYQYTITNTSIAGFYYADRFFCSRISSVIPTYATGKIAISRLDRTQRIIAGIFEATLFNPACGDTVRITKGRFDMRF